ncbi:hypothetical protein [Caulobacter segnis]
MKTTVTREAAKRAPRKTTSIRTNTAPTRAAQSDWVWPGLTRAQLRDIVIDQIG